MGVMLKNVWTTTAGFAGGVLYYANSVGGVFPKSKGEWINFGIAAAMAGLGYAAKDATTGSAPK